MNTMYTLRKLETRDLDKVDSMIAKAKRNMRDVLKIDQWQAGYPNRDTYTKDIYDGIGYVFCDSNDVPVGVAAVTFDGEPLYDVIEPGEFPGKWQGNEGEYAAVHRFCVELDVTCRGVGSRFMSEIAEFCKANGKNAIRIDTHRYNKAMRRMLAKCGFCETGIIYIPEPNSNERITYEKLM